MKKQEFMKSVSAAIRDLNQLSNEKEPEKWHELFTQKLAKELKITETKKVKKRTNYKTKVKPKTTE